MKKLVLLVSLIAIAFTLTYCSTEDNSEDESIVLNAERQSGYDEWGFNFQAHNFKSYLINAMLGDPAFEGMPHYRQPGLSSQLSNMFDCQTGCHQASYCQSVYKVQASIERLYY